MQESVVQRLAYTCTNSNTRHTHTHTDDDHDDDGMRTKRRRRAKTIMITVCKCVCGVVLGDPKFSVITVASPKKAAPELGERSTAEFLGDGPPPSSIAFRRSLSSIMPKPH